MPFSHSKSQQIAALILQNARLLLAISCVVIVLFLPGIKLMTADFGTKLWFRQNDPDLKILEEFEKTFGNDEVVIVAMHAKDGLFTADNLNTLHTISESLWQVTDISRVDSFTNFHRTKASGDDIVISPFVDEQQVIDKTYTVSELEQIKQQVLAHRDLPGYLINRDATVALIYGSLIYREDKGPDDEKIYTEIKQLLNRYKSDDLAFHISGHPAINYVFKRYSNSDIKLFTPILIGLIIIYLLFSFRNWAGIAFPLAIIGATFIVASGATGYLGITINSLTFILPSIVIAMGIADSVHLLNSFYTHYQTHGDQKQAATEALSSNLWALFLTSFSTCIGFLSLVPSDIRPVSDLGKIASLSSIMAFLFTIFMVAPLTALIPIKRPTHLPTQKAMPPSRVASYINFIHRRRHWLLALFCLTSVSFGVLGINNEINSNPYKYFRSTNDVAKSNAFILEKFNGAGGLELVIDSRRPQGAKDPAFLKKVEALELWLRQKPYVGHTLSIVSILKEMNQALMGGDASEYRLHSKPKTIAEELFLYTMGLPEGLDLKNRLDLDEQKLRLTVSWSLQDSNSSLAAMDETLNKARELGLDAHATGKMALFQRLNGHIVNTFFQSMGLALVTITLLLIIIFKNGRNGLLSLIPNFIPVLFGAGCLSLLGKNIDVGCAIVASVTLGIAVDDTIHFLFHYNQQRKSGVPPMQALTHVLSHTGLALIITTVILVSGLGLFVFAELVTNINFGLLCSIVLTMALVCDLIFLPAILLITDRQKFQP